MKGRTAIAAAAVALLLGAPMMGCSSHEHKGPAQKAGEKVDSAIETTGDAAKKAGDKVGNAAKKTGNKIEDATDVK